MAHELTLAKTSNRYQKIMIGSITHEFRTPLNSSINALELLEEGVPPEYRKYLRIAKTSNRLLASLIEDILDLTRHENGEFTVNVYVFKLRNVANTIVELFEFQAEAKGLRLVIDASERTLNSIVSADRRRIEQVLLNLVSNALKFTSEGEIRFGMDHRGNSIFFEVSDTGIGIAPDNMGMLFKLFGKLKASEGMNKGGCGIGLHISQMIIGKLGSKINVKSTPNEGTVFSFELPLSQEQNIAERTSTEEDQIAKDIRKSVSTMIPSQQKFTQYQRRIVTEEEKHMAEDV